MKLQNWFKNIATALMIGTALVACESNSDQALEEVALDTELLESTTDEAYAEVIMEEVSDFGEDAVGTAIEGGRFALRRLPECAALTVDRPNRTITIDFGEGCVGRAGRTRTGQIILSYSSRQDPDMDMARTLTFQNYTVNGNAVEGVITHTRMIDREAGQRGNTCQVSNFAITFANDGSIFSIDQSTRTRTWTRTGEESLQLEVTGSASGTTRGGKSFTMEISTPILHQSDCVEEGRYYPISGIKTRTVGVRPSASIDFGDGTCDDVAVVTVGDRSKEITLRR